MTPGFSDQIRTRKWNTFYNIVALQKFTEFQWRRRPSLMMFSFAFLPSESITMLFLHYMSWLQPKWHPATYICLKLSQSRVIPYAIRISRFLNTKPKDSHRIHLLLMKRRDRSSSTPAPRKTPNMFLDICLCPRLYLIIEHRAYAHHRRFEDSKNQACRGVEDDRKWLYV